MLQLLQVLQLYDTEISKVSFLDGVCPNLRHLSITFCNDLVEVGTLPTTLNSLDLRGVSCINDNRRALWCPKPQKTGYEGV